MPNPCLEPDSDLFQARSAAFIDWFTSFDSTRIHPKLELTDLRGSGTGRGIVTQANIAQDEELFAIPRSLVLNVPNSTLQQHVVESLEDFGSWNSLILVIIYEYLRREASPWFAYLQVLPTTFDTLMFWSSDELAELQGSAVLDKIGKEEAEESWKRSIIPFMQKYPALFSVGEVEPEKQLCKLAHMAGSLIMAYAFDLGHSEEDEEQADEDGFVEDDEDDPAKGMVPLADMLNAEADRNNARLFYEENFLIMKATKPISAGDEIFNDYGPLPRSDLLRMYGYVSDSYSQYDIVEIPTDLIQDVAADLSTNSGDPQLKKALTKLGFVEDGYIISRPAADGGLEDMISPELHMLLSALIFLRGGSGKRPRQSEIPMKPWRDDVDSCVLLREVAIRRLATYRTTVEQDGKILRTLADDEIGVATPQAQNIARHRRRMAVQVRKGEKEILHHVIRLCQLTSRSGDYEGSAEAPTLKRKRDEQGNKAKSVQLKTTSL